MWLSLFSDSKRPAPFGWSPDSFNWFFASISTGQETGAVGLEDDEPEEQEEDDEEGGRVCGLSDWFEREGARQRTGREPDSCTIA